MQSERGSGIDVGIGRDSLEFEIGVVGWVGDNDPLG